MTTESRLTDVEESLALLRDADRLQGRKVSATAPSNTEVLGWNNTTKKWEPQAGGGGSGSMTTVKEGGSQVGGADIVILDFLGDDFDITESPDKEINIVIAGAIARDSELHNEAHTVASHSDTTGTGAELNELTDGSETTLHSHAGGGGGGGQQPTIVLSAAGGRPTTTAGCDGPAQVEYGTNDVDIDTLDFDPDDPESVYWLVAMPSDWDTTADMTAKFYCTVAGGTGGWVFGIKAVTFRDGDLLDASYGAEVVAIDARQDNNKLHISPATSDITPGGTAAAGNLIQFKVTRVVGHASDTLTADVQLIAVVIEYGVS